MSHLTLVVVEAFESQLMHGTGDLTPELDEIAIILKRQAGLSLSQSRDVIDARLDIALRELTRRGWTSVKVTDYYLTKYKGQKPSHPDTDIDIARCVAGRGRGLLTSAVHFCLTGRDCILFIEASIHGLQSGRGATNSTLNRMRVAAETNTLSSDGVEKIAVGAPAQLTIGSIRKIAKP